MANIRWLTSLLYFLKYAYGDMESYIVGGIRADITQFPHSAFITSTLKNNGEILMWICGGSILNQWTVLTAGHCVEGCLPDSDIYINIGDENKNNAQVFEAERYAIYFDYDTDTLYGDIALVKINKRFNFSLKVKRVAIMPNPPYKEQAYVAGWGVIDKNAQLTSPYLRYLDQTLVSSKKCNETLHLMMPDRSICASSTNPSHYPEIGDSGSALVVRGYIQIGLVSFKIQELSKSLIVYTDVGKFYNWIITTTKLLSCI